MHERVAGVFVVAAVLALVAVVLASDTVQRMFGHHILIYGVASNAQGVSTDTLVRVLGIEAGTVESVAITDANEVVIAMRISETYRGRIRQDSLASLTAASLLSAPSIEITPGSSDSPPLDAGGRLVISQSPTLNDLVLGIQPILARVAETVDQIHVLVASVDPGRVTDLLQQAAARLSELQGLIGSATATSESTRMTADALPGLVSELERVVEQVNVALDTLNPELARIPDLVTRSKATVDEANRTIKGLQQIWPLSRTIERPTEERLIKPQPIHD